MSTKTVVLQPVQERGWRMGFANLFRKEMSAWWGTRFWLVQSLVWLVILNGIVAAVLWRPNPNLETPVPKATDSEVTSLARLMQSQDTAGLLVFVEIAGIVLVIGTIIIVQSAIVDEKQSGTVAWVLSKPVSRSAFVLSKLFTHAFGILVILVLLQGLVAYLQISLAGKSMWPPVPFLAALSLVFLNLLFYLALTLMLGTLLSGRGLVIGIPLAILFGYQFLLAPAPWLADIMPWVLTQPTGPNSPSLAIVLALQQPLPTILPIAATIVWIVLFVVVALWRFERIEF